MKPKWGWGRVSWATYSILWRGLPVSALVSNHLFAKQQPEPSFKASIGPSLCLPPLLFQVLQQLLTSFRVKCVLHPVVLSALPPQTRSFPLPPSLLSPHPNHSYFNILQRLFLAWELTSHLLCLLPWLLFLSTMVYFIPLLCGGVISMSLLYRDHPRRLSHVNKTLSPATVFLQFSSFFP